MIEYKVYLAGPMSGLSFEEALKWREEFKAKLKDSGNENIHCFSPLRGRKFIEDYEKFDKDREYSHPLGTHKAINTRDHNDVKTSDLVLVNFLGAKTISIGTVMEIAWAWSYKKPIVMITDEENIHNHPMIRECVGFFADSLDQAVELVCDILND